MKWDDKQDRFDLSTGSWFYAHGGYLAPLNPERVAAHTADGVARLEPLPLAHGWDGHVHGVYTAIGEERDLTRPEREEIAAYMVAAWQKWAQS